MALSVGISPASRASELTVPATSAPSHHRSPAGSFSASRRAKLRSAKPLFSTALAPRRKQPAQQQRGEPEGNPLPANEQRGKGDQRHKSTFFEDGLLPWNCKALNQKYARNEHEAAGAGIFSALPECA